MCLFIDYNGTFAIFSIYLVLAIVLVFVFNLLESKADLLLTLTETRNIFTLIGFWCRRDIESFIVNIVLLQKKRILLAFI